MKFTRNPEPALVLTGESGRLPAIDFLRSFSILTVVLMHLVQSFMPSLPTVVHIASTVGGTGAHLFIFCSGFGLCLSMLRRPQTVRQFFLRRFGRMYLPYVPVVLLMSILPIPALGEWGPGVLFSHLLLYKMFVPRYMESLCEAFWFVSTIVQFYLIFLPLCRLRAKMRSMRPFLCLSLGLSLVWWIFLGMSGLYVERIWNSFFLQFLWEFALGMAAAEYLHSGRKIRLSIPMLIAIATVGLGMQAGIAFCGYPLRLFNDIPALFGYGAAALLLYTFTRGRWDSLWARTASRAYPLYLLHMPIFALIFSLCPGGLAAECMFALTAFALSLLAAWGYGGLIAYISRKYGGKTA